MIKFLVELLRALIIIGSATIIIGGTLFGVIMIGEGSIQQYILGGMLGFIISLVAAAMIFGTLAVLINIRDNLKKVTQ